MKPMLFPQGQLRRSGVSKTGMEPLGSFFGLFLPGLMCYQGAQPAWIIVIKQQNGGQVWAYWTGWSWAVLGQTHRAGKRGPQHWAEHRLATCSQNDYPWDWGYS